jgi:NAD(P)-dependent dehydrogenase (short-subunit alcohol dehydrogenase family)
VTESKKISVVTGANRGLGLEISRQRARDHGFHVVLTARDPANVAAAVQALRDVVANRAVGVGGRRHGGLSSVQDSPQWPHCEPGAGPQRARDHGVIAAARAGFGPTWRPNTP